ncbi:MBL fold metallo-hydrolase [Microscilla marina]|uniref:Zn-dependent hydrolase GumP n=1 Tax=Microscilla marina ATCC 23134 TaxID=313606 RepID=A1ZS76_MICM2|nr:MBL fold metallo-hydrolase [Microscilla marina]EAY26799.1 Zn-dependent hydrolase GumP [Microscilla marina ATCC 23134]
MKKVKLYLNYAGYCVAKESEVIQGGKSENVQFNALWGLIEHPDKGWILYDTGYTRRFHQATGWFPNKIYALLSPVVIREQDEVKAQLQQAGIAPEDIKHIIITHFHADHVGGLKDFPNATFYASRQALDYTLSLSAWTAFSKGVLKDLLPKNLKQRTVLIDETCEKMTDPIFGHKYDLFGDDSLYIYELPGHAAGQIGVMLETKQRPYFLVADACWIKRSYEEVIPPNPIVVLFFHSWFDFKRTLQKMHDYHVANPQTLLVPTHCAATTDALVQDKLAMNVL